MAQDFFSRPRVGASRIARKLPRKISARENARANQRHRDFREPDDDACITSNSRASRQNRRAKSIPFSHVKPREPLFPRKKSTESFRAIRKQYDMREIIARIMDAGEFEEYPPNRRALLCGYSASEAGLSVLSRIRKNMCKLSARAPTRSALDIGGVDYTESAEKAARFILDCNQKSHPAHLSPRRERFMVGKDAE